MPETTSGCEHSWWFYLVRVDASLLGASVDDFAAALKSEGLPVNPHYIGQAVYKYPLFQNHSAFAHADHPFSARTYGKGLCPIAEEILATCIMLKINEGYTAKDLAETVRAFRRVTAWFNSRSLH
ncbi:MAG TPA: DegT/DnrJ/EryC1/StrS family aminotransferase [Tepidisphaeraceae bacterium]